MSRIKNMTVAAITAAALAVGLSGCGGQPEAASSTSASTDSGPVTFWVMGDTASNFQKLVKPFTDQTGIKVNAVAVPWDSIDQKFTTAVASGNGPDLLQIGISKLRNFADSGALLPLQDKLNDYGNLAADKFIDGMAGEATAVQGDTVSVPWVSDTRVLFYRTDILEANGISEPPATWDELREDAKKLAARGKGQFGYYIPQWDSALPVAMTWGQGGSVVNSDGKINFNTPEFSKAVDLYAGLYGDKSVPTDSNFDQTQGFVSGATPMVVSGPYLAKAINDAAPKLKGKWSATTLPSGTTNTSLLAGSNIGVMANSKHQDSALKLADYLALPATQLEWYKLSGELPSVKAALADSSMSSDPLNEVYAKQLENAKVLPLVPNWDGGVGKDLLTALNSIALTGADRNTALEQLYQSTGEVSAK
jgi:multiple sugar transport system substrate-binding protein